MFLRLAAAAVALASLAAPQSGTVTKRSASEYPAHVIAPGIEIGAEYLVRSFGSGEEMYISPDHIVLEVAVFPVKGAAPLSLQAGQFLLRVNGKKKDDLFPQAPTMVAASLKYSDWSMRPRLEAGGGMGDGGVIIGRPRPEERFPGDNRAPRPPLGGQTATITEQKTRPAEQLVVEAALPEGPATGPVSGYLYYGFRKKPKSIKSLELIYTGGTEPVILKLF